MREYVPGKLTSKSYLQTLFVIHLAMLTGQVLFGVVVYVLNKGKSSSPAENDLFIFIVPFVIAAGFIISIFFFRKKLETLRFKESLKEKLQGYNAAIIVRYACLQGPSLFSIVTYLLTGNLLYLLLSGLIILYFICIRPSREKLIEELNLTKEQSAVFDNPDAVIEV